MSWAMGFNDSSAAELGVQPQPCFPPTPTMPIPWWEIDLESPAESFVAISIFGFVFFGISVTMKYSPSTCGSLARDFGTSPLLSQSQKKRHLKVSKIHQEPPSRRFFSFTNKKSCNCAQQGRPSLLRGQRQIVPWGDLFVVCQEEETVVVRTLLVLGN